jgi:hypothetical protein
MKPLQFFALTAVGTALLLYAAPADAALASAQTSDIPMNSPRLALINLPRGKLINAKRGLAPAWPLRCR